MRVESTPSHQQPQAGSGAVSLTDKDGTSQTAVTSSETSFSLTVEGTLDKRELRDLRKVARFLAGRRGTRRGEAGQAAVASGPGHGGQRQRVSLAVADADWRRARLRTRRPNNRLRTRNRSSLKCFVRRPASSPAPWLFATLVSSGQTATVAQG